MITCIVMLGLGTFLVMGYLIGRASGRNEAAVEWIARVRNSREVHMTDVFNLGRLSTVGGPEAVLTYAGKALAAIPCDVNVSQAMPKTALNDLTKIVGDEEATSGPAVV